VRKRCVQTACGASGVLSVSRGSGTFESVQRKRNFLRVCAERVEKVVCLWCGVDREKNDYKEL